MIKGKKILVGISGGIAAYKICYLVRMLVKSGAEVKIIMTPAAVNFVSPVTLSALSRNEVIINMFPSGDAAKAEKIEVKTWHVNLGLWADVFVIAPATANTIAKAAAGICDNFLLSAILASKAPVIIAPAMDDDMYKNKVTKRNLTALIECGHKIIYPHYGELASGIIGEGRMAEPEDIFEYLDNFFSAKSDLKGRKILVTAGPTREYLDKVRFISNPSTGKMGFEIARAAKERGADVTLVSGPVFINHPEGVRFYEVTTGDEMFRKVKSEVSGKDLIIMAAAVEDFSPVKKADVKIKKEGQENFTFEFKKTVDILEYLGENKKKYKLFGFAVETDNELNNAFRKLKNKNLDLIVMNNPNVKGAGFGTDTNIVTIVTKSKKEQLPLMSKFEVANAILDKYTKMK